MVHDTDHPGVMNPFLIATRHPLAVLYNERSVLENHHAATTFGLLQDDRLNVLSGLTPEQRKEARLLIVKSIMATDMAHHSEMIRELTEIAAQQRPDVHPGQPGGHRQPRQRSERIPHVRVVVQIEQSSRRLPPHRNRKSSVERRPRRVRQEDRVAEGLRRVRRQVVLRLRRPALDYENSTAVN